MSALQYRVDTILYVVDTAEQTRMSVAENQLQPTSMNLFDCFVAVWT